MSVFAYWFLIIFGILGLGVSIYNASQHGKPKGNYNGATEAVAVLLDFIILLIGLGVL